VISWVELPLEVSHLLNPAFCGLMLHKAVDSYCAERNEAMPFPLSYLVLPIVLHEETRRVLPPAKTTTMHLWLQRYPQARVGFALRATRFVEFTSEGLRFLFAHGNLLLVNGGGASLRPSARGPVGGKALSELGPEVRECIRAAGLVGRWFANCGTPWTAFALWGIRP
jgi:hypothetical protein